MVKFNIFNLKIKIHISFIVLMILFVVFNFYMQFTMIFFIVTIHELSHVFVANIFEREAKEIIILPIGEIAKIENVETLSLVKKVAILLAGPFCNFMLFFSTTMLFKDNYNFFKTSNLYICLFNLLPIMPLDGGRILNYIFCNRFGIINASKISSKISNVFGWFILIIGLIQMLLFPLNISLFFIGLYIIKSDNKTNVQLHLEFLNLVLNKYKHKTYKKRLIFQKKLDYNKLSKMLNWDYYYVFIINNKYRISEEELLRNYCGTI